MPLTTSLFRISGMYLKKEKNEHKSKHSADPLSVRESQFARTGKQELFGTSSRSSSSPFDFGNFLSDRVRVVCFQSTIFTPNANLLKPRSGSQSEASELTPVRSPTLCCTSLAPYGSSVGGGGGGGGSSRWLSASRLPFERP